MNEGFESEPQRMKCRRALLCCTVFPVFCTVWFSVGQPPLEHMLVKDNGGDPI